MTCTLCDGSGTTPCFFVGYPQGVCTACSGTGAIPDADDALTRAMAERDRYAARVVELEAAITAINLHAKLTNVLLFGSGEGQEAAAIRDQADAPWDEAGGNDALTALMPDVFESSNRLMDSADKIKAIEAELANTKAMPESPPVQDESRTYKGTARCPFCRADTLQEFHDSGHERDSSGDRRTCLTCGATKFGFARDWSAPRPGGLL